MTVVRVFAGGAVSELVHVQLAQQDGPRVPEPGRDGAILFWNKVVEQA